jgi:hypothetical protein
MYRTRILGKLQLSTTAELIRYAVMNEPVPSLAQPTPRAVPVMTAPKAIVYTEGARRVAGMMDMPREVIEPTARCVDRPPSPRHDYLF